MPLAQGWTRFRGVVMLSLEANELRTQTRRLRSFVRTNQTADAHEVYLQMLDFVGDAPEARQAVQDVWNEQTAILNERQNDDNGTPATFWKIHN